MYGKHGGTEMSGSFLDLNRVEKKLFCCSCADIKETQVKHLIRLSYLGSVQWCLINMSELFVIHLVWLWVLFWVFSDDNGMETGANNFTARLQTEMQFKAGVSLFCFIVNTSLEHKKKTEGRWVGWGCAEKQVSLVLVSKWLAACTVIWETTENKQSV